MQQHCYVHSLIGSKRLYLQGGPDAVRRQQKPAPLVQAPVQSQRCGQEGSVVRQIGGCAACGHADPLALPLRHRAT